MATDFNPANIDDAKANCMLQTTPESAVDLADRPALFVLPIRLIVGWTFFSAFWRRVALADELNPHAHGYIGEKFNHFLPHALGMKPIIEYLVTHPSELRVAMTTFTLVEAVVGLCLMLGLFTRLMALGVTMLAFGILLGSGWLGSTCVDEWQIGILGVASGCVLFFSGGGGYSLDRALSRHLRSKHRRWLTWLASGEIAFPRPAGALAGAAVLSLALFTNQYFHGGLWGPLHNDSVKPVLEASHVEIGGNTLRFDLSRTAGPDTYGAFLIRVALTDATTGRMAMALDADQLSTLPAGDIVNHHVTQVHPGKYSLVVPLGSLARVSVGVPPMRFEFNDRYLLALTDISGTQWTTDAKVVTHPPQSQ